MEPEYPLKIRRKEEQVILRKKKLGTEQPQGRHILGQYYKLERILLITYGAVSEAVSKINTLSEPEMQQTKRFSPHH